MWQPIWLPHHSVETGFQKDWIPPFYILWCPQTRSLQFIFIWQIVKVEGSMNLNMNTIALCMPFYFEVTWSHMMKQRWIFILLLCVFTCLIWVVRIYLLNLSTASNLALALIFSCGFFFFFFIFFVCLLMWKFHVICMPLVTK